MRLDRNIKGNEGLGKYALIRLRDLKKKNELQTEQRVFPKKTPIQRAIATLQKAGVIEWGETLSTSEFFVIKLRDLYARDALLAYADACDDEEFAAEVRKLADRAGPNSPFQKKPD